MNKTTTIHIQGTIFTLEEDAYTVLKQYLDDIAAHFADSPDKEDIIQDIERSIAEKWSTEHSDRSSVMTVADVERMIGVLGRVEDFDTDESTPHTEAGSTETPRSVKRLYRNTDDALIAGVASGIGTYFGIDPVFIRIAFVALTFFGGSGIILYLILWLITPAATTSVQKAEMSGKPITLETITSEAKKMIEKAKQNNPGIAPTLQQARKTGEQFLKRFYRFFVNTMSILFMIISAIIVCAVVFVITTLLFSPAELPIEPGIFAQFSNSQFVSVVLAIGMVVLIPFLTILLACAGTLRKKAVLTLSSSLILGGLWCASIAISIGMLVSIVPRIQQYIEETNPTIIQELSVDGVIDTIDVHGNTIVNVVQGETTHVEVRGRAQLLERMPITENTGTLTIGNVNDNGLVDDGILCITCITEPAHVTITLPDISTLSAHDVSQIDMEQFSLDTLTVSASDASRIDILSLSGETVTLATTDVARISITGNAERGVFNSHDSSYIDAEAFMMEDAQVTSEDVSQIEYTEPERETNKPKK